MELPTYLKDLYRHWNKHTSMHPEESIQQNDTIEGMQWFIQERMRIWKDKVQNIPPPYTNDPILSKYRFCNIFREFDAQTICFHKLLNPIREDFNLWLLNIFYCRMIARPETIIQTGLLSFNKTQNNILLSKLRTLKRPIYGTPYVFPISTILRSEYPTRELFITQFLPEIIPQIAKQVETWDTISVWDGVHQILPQFGFKLSFLWTEVLIDTAYQYPHLINLFERFPIGPGAMPTLLKVSKETDPSLLVVKLSKIKLNSGITINDRPLRISAENWEGIACEYRKYVNLRNGFGRKRLYSNS